MDARKIFTHLAVCVALAGAVLITFSPVLRADFLRWDDRAYVVDNDAVYIPLDRGGLARIFSEKTAGQYVPLAVLSYALDYRIGGDSPATHHTTNLILHILNTLLAYWLARRLGLRTWSAVLAAVLFALHPMRVETVAWIAQRKYLLFSLFFLLGLLYYDMRLRALMAGTSIWRQRISLVAANGFGILSVLAHPMALGLPVAFLLLDWFRGRRLSPAALTEKLPLALVAMGVGSITLGGIMRGPVVPGGQAVLIAFWTCVFFLRQYLIPLTLVPIVRIPAPITIMQPEYAMSVAFCLLLLICLYRLRRVRWLLLAFGFFGCGLIFVILFGSAKAISLAADRFMYLPGLGLTLLGAYVIQRTVQSPQLRSWWGIIGRVGISGALTACLLISAVSVYRQAYVWQNDIALWRHQLMFYPGEPVALNGLAVALREKDEFQRAEDHYRKMVAVAAQGYELKLDDEARGNIRRVKYVVDLMRRAKSGAPHLADIPFKLGQYLQDLGLYKDAVEEYRRAVQIDPGFKAVYLDLGRIYLDLKDLDKAALAFRQYYVLDPVRDSDYLQVVNIYAEYLSQDPKNIALRSGLLDVITEFVNFANERSLGAESYAHLGLMYIRAGETAQARETLQRALELNPRQVSALYALGVLLMDAGDRQAAMQLFEQVTKIDGKHADALVKIGNIQYGMGNLALARDYYHRAIARDPKNAQAYFNLGYTYEEAGQLGEAAKRYRLALHHDPVNAEAHFNLGNVYVKQDNLDGAVREYLHAVKENPDHVDAWVNLAVTSYNAGMTAEAKKYYEEAVMLGFEPPPAMVRKFGAAR